MIFLIGYARSPFRDFESYLRIVVDLDEDDIQLISKQYNSDSVTYKLIMKEPYKSNMMILA